MNYSRINDFRQLFLSSNDAAKKGRNLLDSYINQNNVTRLAWLLRHHDEGDITDQETFARDHVDYFIEYFSILSLAHLTGYLDRNEIEQVQAEIAYYLGNVPIRRYYYRNYPLLFPQLLLELVMKKRYFEKGELMYDADRSFEKFHLLNQTIDNDDVNQFLWFLDGGSNNNFDIDDVRETLSDYNSTQEILKSHRKDALGESIRGFFDYIEFLENFADFLAEIPDSLHQAAYWYYHEYWFSKIKSRLTPTINRYFKGLSAVAYQGDEEIDGALLKSQIEISHAHYLNLVDKLIIHAPHRQYFEDFVKWWRRGGEGHYSAIPESPIAVG